MTISELTRPEQSARLRKQKAARDTGVIDGFTMRAGRGSDAKTVIAVIRALKAMS